MRIEPPKPDPALRHRVRGELKQLLRQPTVAQARPCPDCDVPCPCSGSPACSCGCSAACPYAREKMSSEAEAAPVETRIAPLVYELYSLRLCRPFWSCEGHARTGGALARVPTIWFHSSAVVYPWLIGEYLQDLRIAKRTVHPWHVCLKSLEHPTLGTAFSIEPDLTFANGASLRTLQQDVDTIAAGFSAGVREMAQRQLHYAAGIGVGQ